MRNRHALEPMVLPSQAFCDCWYSPSTVDEVENICARPSNLARIPPGRLTSRNYESALFPTFSELQLFVHFMRLEHPVRIGSTPNTQDTFLFTLAWHFFTGITSVQLAVGDAKRCGPGLLGLSIVPQCKPIFRTKFINIPQCGIVYRSVYDCIRSLMPWADRKSVV